MTSAPSKPIDLEPDDGADVLTPACAQCGSTKPWGTSSWCPDCGFYPGISDRYEGEEEGPPDNDGGDEEKDASETVGSKPMIPVWAQLSLGGFAVILIFSTILSNVFYYMGGDRGLWALCQLTVGVLSFVGAQFCTTIYAMKESDDVTLTDAVVTPLEVWRHTFKMLPEEGGNRIVAAVWGITLAVAAVAIIGGIDYESFFDTPIVAEREKRPDVVKRIITKAVDTTQDTEEAFDESLENFTDKLIDIEAQGDLEMGLPSEDEPLSCFIYGYMNDGRRGELGRILLGAQVNGQLQHVGEIEAKRLPYRLRQNLKIILPSLMTNKPVVESAFRGTWVKPTKSLDIEFEGWTVGGTMIEPILHLPEEEAPE